jgi:hypothetical protein
MSERVSPPERIPNQERSKVVLVLSKKGDCCGEWTMAYYLYNNPFGTPCWISQKGKIETPWRWMDLPFGWVQSLDVANGDLVDPNDLEITNTSGPSWRTTSLFPVDEENLEVVVKDRCNEAENSVIKKEDYANQYSNSKRREPTHEEKQKFAIWSTSEVKEEESGLFFTQ